MAVAVLRHWAGSALTHHGEPVRDASARLPDQRHVDQRHAAGHVAVRVCEQAERLERAREEVELVAKFASE